MKLSGGLGNQMFQYALGRHLSLLNNTGLILDVSSYSRDKLRKFALDVFRIEARVAHEDDFSDSGNRRKMLRQFLDKLIYSTKYIKERKLRFDDSILKEIGNLHLEGFWASEKYFIGIRNTVRSDFRLKNTRGVLKNTIDEYKKKQTVSLHVRRADFITNKVTHEFHGVLDSDYYRKAMSIIDEKMKKPVYLVFSDDVNWCKKNFRGTHRMVYVDADWNLKDYEELAFMSTCRHHIIANSTFSWWGAWLNPNPQKIVIAPEKWLRERSADTSDVIPGDWIKI